MGALTSVAGRAVSGGAGLTRADALAAEAAMDALRQLLAPGTPSTSPSASPQVPHSCSSTTRGRCSDLWRAQLNASGGDLHRPHTAEAVWIWWDLAFLA